MIARRLVILAALAVAGTTFAAAGPVLAQAADAQPASRPAAPSPLERANADAVAKLESQIVNERLDDGITVAQVLDRCGGLAELNSDLNEAEQIGGPRYVTQDLVQVQRQISGQHVATIVRNAVDARPDRSPIPRDRLDRILSKWDNRSFTSTGNSSTALGGSGAEGSTANASQPTIAIPDRAPDWSNDPITVAAFSPASGSQLRTARAAERDARSKLHAQIAKLDLDGRHTLGDLAAANPTARERIESAIQGAGVSGVDYHADGSVEIRLSLDGQRLWQSLQMAR